MKKIELNKNSTILDVGAQQGLYSMLSKFYPDTKWHSFEPYKFSYDLLNSHLEYEKISNVSTYNIALSDKKEERYLYVPKRKGDKGGLNCIAQQNGRINLDDCDKILIKTDTIDNLFLNEHIDIIKMDVEGFELNVLKGGLKTITKCRPCILIEYMPYNMKTCGITSNQVDEFFRNINYNFVQLEFGERFYYPM